MKHLNKTNNFIYLFFSLLALLLSASIIAEYPTVFGVDLFTLMIIIMFVVSIRSLKMKTLWKHIIYYVIVTTLLVYGLSKLFEYKIFVYVTLLALLLFFVGSFVMNAKQILFEGPIDFNKIVGSITLYLLFGLIWAIIYLLLLTADPQAFSGIQGTRWQEMFARAAYFSFVTLTTLGYGDIIPHNHIASFFVYIEAIFGIFYTAIIVSSLITLRHNSNEKGHQES